MHFAKGNIAIGVQFGKYAFVAYDLFVKHLLFYSGGVIKELYERKIGFLGLKKELGI